MNLSKQTLKFFEFQAKNYFGLSIKDTSLNVVQSSESDNHLKSFSFLNLPTGIVQNGEIKNPKAFFEALKKLISSSQIKTPFVVLNIPETKVFGKIIEIPSLSEEELNEAVSWQAEDQIPLDKSKIYYDFKILEKNDQETKIYLLAAPKKTIDKLTSNIQRAGLIPVAIESSALALTRFVPKDTQSPVLIVETESPLTVLSVTYKGTVLISSSFETPQKDPGLFEKELSKEVLHLREFCQKKLKTNFTSALFFGDLSLKANPKTLSALNLKTISPFLSIKNPPSQFISHFQSLALSSSLSQKKTTPPSDVNSINLLPPELQGIYDLKEKQQFLSRLCFSLILSLGIITFCLATTWVFLILNLKKLESEIKSKLAQGPNGEAILVEKSAREVNLRSNQIIALSTQIAKTSTDLITLGELVPDKLNISSLSLDYNQNQFSLSGLALEREDVIKLNKDFKESKIFGNPEIPLKSLEKKENVEFTINFQKKTKP